MYVLKTLINTVGFRLVLLFLFRYQSQLDTSWYLGFQLLHQRRRLAAVIPGVDRNAGAPEQPKLKIESTKHSVIASLLNADNINL